MTVSGLVDNMSCSFRGVDHMLTGKNFTHTFRALRLLVVETVIQNIAQEANGDDDLI